MIASTAPGAAVFTAASLGLILVEDGATRSHADRRLVVEGVERCDREIVEVDVAHTRQVGAVDRRRLLEGDGDVVFGSEPSTGIVAFEGSFDAVSEAYVRTRAETSVGDFVSG